MTTLFTRKSQCFVCGNTAEYTVIGSTNTFGSPDLDTRPPEMMRSTMPFWVQKCPHCGYCAPDISAGSEAARDIVETDVYRAQVSDDRFPQLANRFLCAALVFEVSGKLAEAGWAAVRAAWACDDAGTDDGARLYREKALASLADVRERGQVFARDAASEDAVLADLYRRTGQFERVEVLCRERLAQQPGELLGMVLRFQLDLASRDDVACYTVEDAQRYVNER